MTLTAIELHQLLTEARRGAGNDKLTIQQQLTKETEAHAETAAELSGTIKRQAEYIESLKSQIENLKEQAENYATHCGAASKQIDALEDEIRTLKQDIETWRGVAKDDEQQKEQLKTERDIYKQQRESAMATIQEMSEYQTGVLQQLQFFKAEAAALSRDAGYWRALKAGWTGPTFIAFHRLGTATFRGDDGNSYEAFTCYQDAVKLATGYKPEEA